MAEHQEGSGSGVKAVLDLLWSPVRRLKLRMLYKLAENLDFIREQRDRPQGLRLGAMAKLKPGAVVENFAGDEDRVTIGARSVVYGRLLTYGHGGRISVGEDCFVGLRTEIWSMDSITIGNRVLVSHDVNIHDGTAHSLDPEERATHFQHMMTRGHPRTWSGMPGVQAAPIVIEDDVWISFGVTILKGVRIGAGSVIAAGSMVTRDVPPGMLYRCEFKPIVTPLPKRDAYHEDAS